MRQIGILMLAVTTAFAQINEERMVKDLKIAENVLKTMLSDQNQPKQSSVWGMLGAGVKANYIEDFGVIFTITGRGGLGESVTITGSTGKALIAGEEYVFSYGGVPENSQSEAKIIIAEGEEENEVTYEDLKSMMFDEKIEIIIDFLANYASLIGQLKADDKILITDSPASPGAWTGTNSLRLVTGYGPGSANGSFTVEVTGELISSYKSGKINLDQFKEKAVIKILEEEPKVRDLELFGSMLSRIYQADLSDTYYTNTRNTPYSRIDGLGAIYTMKVYSSLNQNGIFSITTINKEVSSEEERNEIVKEMYPDFVQSLKENIVDYGRTITSLKDDEMLFIKVTLTSCADCGIPREVELSVKAETLQQFNNGRLSREKALDQIKVTETGIQ